MNRDNLKKIWTAIPMGTLRPALTRAKEILKPGCIIAEVGVAAGEHARQMCKALKPSLIYLIDIKNTLIRRVWDNNPPAPYVFIEKESRIASLEIPDKLDFIYIDALEDEYNTLIDIACWYPLLKIGGVIGGHDYVPNRGTGKATKLLFGNVENRNHGNVGLEGIRGDWYHIKTKEGFLNV